MVIDVDEDGDVTMEDYIDENEEWTVGGTIKADENHFEFVEGSFWDMELDNDNWWIGPSPVNEGTKVVLTDTYINPELTANDNFEYIFAFRPWGEEWKEAVEHPDDFPPGYEDYLKMLAANMSDPYVDSVFNNPFAAASQGESTTEVASPTTQPATGAETSKPTIDTSGMTFTFNPDPDNYGKDGWAYTKSGTIRLQMAKGWDIANALNDTSVGVRSAPTKGDTIQIYIQDYSSMLAKNNLENTPRNEFLSKNKEQDMKTDRWGNVDVWYRLIDWGDYTSIAGFAAFTADKVIYFDIRSMAVNGTVEQFMQSDAWTLFKKSLVITPP